jgi:hypothetical protein
MSCKKCNSERIAFVGGKTSDRSWGSIGSNEFDGYVPRDLGIGGGDFIKISYCLDCGQIQGNFPLPKTELETPDDEDGDDEEGFCGI